MERLNAFRVACFRKNSESIQCCIPGAVAEISATIKDLKAAWVENDYQKLYQAVTPIAAAVLGVVSFLEEINTSPGTWYATIDLGNVFFSSIPVSKGLQKLFGFSCQGQQYTFISPIY